MLTRLGEGLEPILLTKLARETLSQALLSCYVVNFTTSVS
jgi:hypothetical protein